MIVQPVRYHEIATRETSRCRWFWDGLAMDWTPIPPSYNPGYDLCGEDRHLTLNGSGVSWKMSAIDTGMPGWDHTGSSGRLERPRIPGFDLNHTDVFTIAVRFSVRNVSSDERTLFSKRVTGGSNHLSIRTFRETAPARVQIRFGGGSRAGLPHINVNVPYTLFLTNDGSGVALGWAMYLYGKEGDLLGTFITDQSYSNANPEAPQWLFASHSNGNDPMQGEMCGTRGWGRILTSSQMVTLARDWYAPYRALDLGIVEEAGPPPTGTPYYYNWRRRVA